MPLRSFLLFAVICLLWALNMVVSRLVVDGLAVPPLAYAALRSAVGCAALLPWLRPIPRQLPKVLAVTFATSGGAFALLFAGLRYTSPSAASIIGLSGAPLTVLFAILILGERVRWRRALGIALTFTGVLVAVADPAGWDTSEGVLLVFASAVVGALGAVFLKQLAVEPLRLQAWATLGSVAVLLPLSLMLEDGPIAAALAAGWELVAALLFSGLVVSVGAHTLYFRLLQQYDANLIAPLTLMTPIFTIGLGVAITGDAVGPALVLGAVIAGSGVLVILLRPSAKLFKPLLVRPRL
jgi:O-acetylserine/cysteine efflux transporter